MKKKYAILWLLALLCHSMSQGQCPERDHYYQNLSRASTSGTSTPADSQIVQINHYLDDCSQKQDSIHAFLLERLGKLYYGKKDFLQSIQSLRQAISIISSLPSQNAVLGNHLIRNYYDLSDAYNALERTGEKMTCIDSCILLSVKWKRYDDYYLYVLWLKVNYLFDLGEYQNCIAFCRMSENAPIILLHNQDDYYNHFLNVQVNALLATRQYEKAESLLRDQLARHEFVSKDYSGPIYAQLAEVEASKGDYHKALFFYKQALLSNQHIKYNMGCLQDLLNVGYYVYDKPGRDPDQALLNYVKAATYINAKNASALDRFEYLNLYTNIANVYAKKHHYDSAFYFYQRAYDQIRTGLKKDQLPSIPLDSFIAYKRLNYLTALLVDHGDAFLSQYNISKSQATLGQAIQMYKIADRLLDRIKNEQSDIGSKLFWRKDAHRLYEHAIEAAYLSHNPGNAFYFFEKSRSVLLADQMNMQARSTNDNILAQAQLRKRMLQLKKQQDTIKSNGNLAADIQNQLFNCNAELDNLVKKIRQTNPLYYQNSIDSSFISLELVQKNILNNYQALVEIFSGDTVMYSLLITHDHAYLHSFDKRTFDSVASNFIYLISNPSLLNSHFHSFTQVSSRLYHLIFRDNPIPDGRIIVSPDERYIPFEALLVGMNADRPEYFIDHHALSYTYSARYLMSEFGGGSNEGENFLGVAPVHYAGFSLASLPGSELSLNKINQYFDKPASLVSASATKTNFLKQYANYKVIQLYTHASDSSLFQEPVIYFIDSALYLSELIPENRPQTRLVVLSACETGNGVVYKGEGVFSFNRGFASLGIPSSIINLWSVDNKSTYELTQNFYRYISEGLPIDLALQNAKLDYMSKQSKINRLPYYWAAMVIVGKSDPVILERKKSWAWIAIWTAIAGMALFAVWQWKERTMPSKRVPI